MEFFVNLLFRLFGKGRFIQMIKELLVGFKQKDYLNFIMPEIEKLVKLAETTVGAGASGTTGDAKYDFVLARITEFLKNRNKPAVNSAINLAIELAVSVLLKK